MKHFIIFFLLTCILNSRSQDYGWIFTTGKWTVNDVITLLATETQKGIDSSTVVSYRADNRDDTLILFVQHIAEGITFKCTFNILKSGISYCDFQEMSFDCSPCSQKHLNQLIGIFKFKKRTENVYMSDLNYKTEMNINYTSDNKDCLVLKFRHVSLSKNEYKTIYNSLQP